MSAKDPNTHCTDVEGLLPLFVGGDLDGEDLALVAAHVEGCGPCRLCLEAARRAREELRAGLRSSVDGCEPQLWPAIRSELHREGLLRAPGEAGSLRPVRSSAAVPGSPVDRAPVRRSSLPRVAAGLAAGVAVLFLIGQGQNGPASPPEAPAPGGELVQDSGDHSPAPSPGDALAGGGELPATSEAPATRGGLRPVGFTTETLFDQAREDLLLEVRRGATMQPGTGLFLPNPSTSPAPEGELASGFRLQ